MGTIDDTNNLKYSLYTVCGYAAEYEGDGSTERKVSALFVYNSIDVAVRILIGKIGYNLFNGISQNIKQLCLLEMMMSLCI